LMFKSRD